MVDYRSKRLIEAAMYGRIQEARRLLSGNVRSIIEERGQMGCSALHLATWAGHKSIVELLLHKGANVNAKTMGEAIFADRNDTGDFRNFQELTPLDFAVRGGHAAIVELLLDRGADANLKATDAHKKAGADTSLHYAVGGKSNAAIVQMLLDKGANLEFKTKRGFTSLHRAIQAAAGERCGQTLRFPAGRLRAQQLGGDHIAVVQLLIAKGANIHASTK